MSSVIKSHNKKVLSGSVVENDRKGCNYPMRGSCLDKSMIYKAEVTTTIDKKHYYGQTFRTFKDRLYGHQRDQRNHGKAESTTFSKYVWQERKEGEEPEIIYSKLSSAKPYSLGGRSCPLCLAEKTAIVGPLQAFQLLHKPQHRHHSPVQPHDVLLYLQPASVKPHDVLLDLQPAPVQPHDVLLDLQSAPVQPHDVLLDLQPAPVQPQVVQPVSASLQMLMWWTRSLLSHLTCIMES
jgi:hypothetical protein